MGGKESGALALETMRQALDGMPQLVKIVDADDRLLYMNPSMRRLLGLGEDVVGRKLFEVCRDSEVGGELRRRHHDVFERGEPSTGEIELLVDGERRQLECIWVPLFEGGEVSAVCTIATDETERRRVKDELATTGGQLRSMIEAFEDVLMLVTPEGEIRFINYTITERSPEEVVGRSFYEYGAPGVRERARQCLERVIATKKPDHFQTEYVGDNGEVSYWECRAFPVIAKDGDEVSMITVAGTNVTERRVREEEQDRFFKISADILCIVDGEGRFRRVNPAFERVLGFSAEEAIGRPFLDWVHPDDRGSSLDVVAAANARSPIEGSEFINRYRHKDGGYRRIAWRGAADPVAQTVYGVGRDVTERFALEEKLRQAQKMEAVGQLAGGIAHDFNNIALSILLNAELGLRSQAGDRGPNPAAKRHEADGGAACHAAEVVSKSFREIREAAQRAADLTRQLLAFSRQTVARFEHVDVNHIAEGVMRLLRRLIPENISVDFIRGESLPPVRADRGQLEQVIMNLCLNARDAMPRGGRIEIETRALSVDPEQSDPDLELQPGRHVVLSVRDTGTGIDSAVIGRIFEPFFTTKPPGSGTGLGLATVYGVVKQHEALIRVDSEPGAGTRFDIYLRGSKQRTVRNVGAPERPVEGGSETILLAEDEELVRAVVVRTLTEAGYAVIVAKDGVEAVDLAEREDAIRLVLLDLVMPNMSGEEACRRIQELRPDVRVLFSSGYVGAVPPETELSVPIIHKPYRPDELLRAIRRVLDEPVK